MKITWAQGFWACFSNLWRPVIIWKCLRQLCYRAERLPGNFEYRLAVPWDGHIPKDKADPAVVLQQPGPTEHWRATLGTCSLTSC